ncbi:MAG: hypothetical protein JRF36_03515 [Deltaproteobacteria bacterium]|jgi:hypothetical protein|nr:hypothetical protein [Deltaproteobacteria bacterium]
MIRKSYIFLKQTLCFFIVAITAMMLTVCVPPVYAEEKPAENSDWEFKMSPYMWFISASGDVTVRGQESDLDLSFSDIWDELNIAAMLVFEGRKNRWGFVGDALYANLGKSTSTDVTGIKIDPTVKLSYLGAGGFYRLGTWDLSQTPANAVPSVTVDAMAGARYTYLDMKLDLKGFRSASGDKAWVDPLVGARAIFDLSERWAASLTGNLGGFGVGSDFTWHAWGLLGYRFSLFSKDNNAAVFGGYRALSWDYTDGGGDDKFEWDVTLHGPILGIQIGF